MSDYRGPSFRRIPQIEQAELSRHPLAGVPRGPLLVKGALSAWPALDRWSFAALSRLRHPDGSGATAVFADGLDDQGVTKPPLELPVAPYLQKLADAARSAPRRVDGLLAASRYDRLGELSSFHLDWSYMESFEPTRTYLSQWDMLSEFPALRGDLRLKDLWRRGRHTWEYAFIGPTKTVTGLHCDMPHNWFLQVQGAKEVILFPPEERELMCISQKYDWGATLSGVDITRLPEQAHERAQFAKAEGYYGRIEAGDALFIPKETWHAFVSLSPSISLGVFGLSPWEIIALGVPMWGRDLLHHLHIYRWGQCTCHDMTKSDAGGSLD